jgi:hypothetical protein
MPATADGHRRSPSSWARFLVASSPSEDLRIHAKHLFVAANQQSLGHTLDGDPARRPVTRRGVHDGDYQLGIRRGIAVAEHAVESPASPPRSCSFRIGRTVGRLALGNKCLARSNKPRTGILATNKGPAARRNSSGAATIRRDPLRGQRCRSFTALWAARVERKMSWHHPDLYFFLCLAGGLAAFLVPSIIEDELLARRRKPPVVEPRRSTMNEKAADPPSPPKYVDLPSPPPYLKNVWPLDGLQRESSRQAGKQAAERFSRLCESVEDLTPKEQASRSREHFGIFGGARPTKPPFGPPPRRRGRA